MTVKISEEIERVANAIVDIISDTITVSLGKMWCCARGPTSTLQHVCVPMVMGLEAVVPSHAVSPMMAGLCFCPVADESSQQPPRSSQGQPVLL